MRIFEEDEVIDITESNKLVEKNRLNNSKIVDGLGIKFSSDKNLFMKKHHLIAYRDQSMEPFTSHVKSIEPFNLIFNSILKKSKLPFYNESTLFSYRYKREEV